MTEQEQAMFGMSREDIRKEYLEGLTGRLSKEMVAIGVLSDAQEVMARGDNERARKYMNIAKFILSEIMDEKLNQKAA